MPEISVSGQLWCLAVVRSYRISQCFISFFPKLNSNKKMASMGKHAWSRISLFTFNVLLSFSLEPSLCKQMQFPYRKEKMSYNNFRESRLRFSDSLNGQRWIFLRKGLDDFRDGFPPSSDNMIVYGKKHPVSIIMKNSTGNSSYTAPGNKSKKCTKTQIYLSKLSPLQQARRDYVAQIEHCLKRHPTVLYPRLEKSSSPKVMSFVILVIQILQKIETGN